MKSLNILVVDDHPLVRDAMANLLAGIAPAVTVLEAADCASALGIAREQPDIDIVVLETRQRLSLPDRARVRGRATQLRGSGLLERAT